MVLPARVSSPHHARSPSSLLGSPARTSCLPAAPLARSHHLPARASTSTTTLRSSRHTALPSRPCRRRLSASSARPRRPRLRPPPSSAPQTLLLTGPDPTPLRSHEPSTLLTPSLPSFPLPPHAPSSLPHFASAHTYVYASMHLVSPHLRILILHRATLRGRTLVYTVPHTRTQSIRTYIHPCVLTYGHRSRSASHLYLVRFRVVHTHIT
ncbi:hypothetical protein B0H19DRAFT_1260237 [Mycena capillaripes]|nr:hypothetical protein B0H19DRAFT_1260237 [Mycena capillaripes]